MGREFDPFQKNGIMANGRLFRIHRSGKGADGVDPFWYAGASGDFKGTTQNRAMGVVEFEIGDSLGGLIVDGASLSIGFAGRTGIFGDSVAK